MGEVSFTGAKAADKAKIYIELQRRFPTVPQKKINKMVNAILESSKPTKVKYGDHFTKGKNSRKELKPNVEYATPQGYTYQTDSKGRIVSCEGTLQLGVAKRKSHAQKTVGRESRKKGDDGGHLIASIFKGSGDYDNLVPMDGNLNKGEWKKLENSWAEALDTKPPKTVRVKITPTFEGDSRRPVSFKVEQTINGRKLRPRFLKNSPGGI
jgi:hypothetical protein